MKKSVFITLFLILILVANISLATYQTVTMEVVEEPVCTIKIGENSKFEKKLISKDLNNKEVTLQLQVTNEETSTQPTGELMLVLDNSESMTHEVEGTTTRYDLIIESATTLINSILKNNTNLKIGVVSFSSNSDTSKEGTIKDANLVSDLSSNPEAINSAISNIQFTGTRTDLDAGLSLASQYFTSEENNKYIIVLTDGVPNIALDFDDYFSDTVISTTKSRLKSLESAGYNIITMLTGIDNPESTPGITDKTYSEIITETFGTETAPTAGKFYYIQDDEIEQTITQNIYNDLLPISHTLTDITITDYFPLEIIDNFEFAYVSQANIGNISAQVNPETNSITWTIPKLETGQTATVQYKLKLKEDFNSNIVDKILDTNEKVDITYTNFEGKKISDTSKITPKLRLTEPPKTLPKAGTPILISLFIVGIGITTFSYIRFKNMER